MGNKYANPNSRSGNKEKKPRRIPDLSLDNKLVQLGEFYGLVRQIPLVLKMDGVIYNLRGNKRINGQFIGLYEESTEVLERKERGHRDSGNTLGLTKDM